ncbi:MAG TPA: hypothetical protein VMH84_06845 [Xanthobacteraceae bacterium]|nr:hypothetical protein [Xanthobacteraceae bacterium]
MLRRVAMFGAVMAALSGSGASALVRIQDDVGGRIGQYVENFAALRDSGDRVMIDGPCLSACTMVLGLIPRDRICVTERALLGFHAAWMPGPQGRPVHSAIGTQTLWEVYPLHVRKWINRKGGLQKKMIFLRGRELAAMYPECH